MIMKYVVVSPKNRTAYNFRGDLIRDIISAGHEVIVTGPTQIDVDQIEALGAKFVEVPMHKNGMNPIADLRYLAKLRKLFRREHPDVVFAYTAKPVIYASIAAKLARVPHIVPMVTGAGYAFTAKTAKAKLVKWVVSILYRIAFACADMAIFQNTDDRDQFLKEKLVKEDRCSIVSGSGVVSRTVLTRDVYGSTGSAERCSCTEITLTNYYERSAVCNAIVERSTR
jgi:hypothetical protein